MVLPDRLGGEKQITFIPVQFVQKTKRLCPDDEEDEEDDDGKIDNTLVENRFETQISTSCVRNALLLEMFRPGFTDMS